MGRFDFARYDAGARGTPVDDETRSELRRLANLFLLSSVTLVVLLLEVFARTLEVTFIPPAVFTASGLVFLVGWAATLVYGVFTTLKAKRWGWLVLCVVPVTCVPAGIAYAWIRRSEIERQVLSDPTPSAARRRRSGGVRR
jgi:hypothetical protein